jgi:IMP dehydrogenase
MRFDETERYCFDDVLLVPQYSEIETRKNIDISTEIVGIRLDTPIISANMDSITEEAMVEAMYECGGLGILHRYSPFNEIEKRIRYLYSVRVPTIPSVGISVYDKTFIKSLLEKKMITSAICLDIAHGHCKRTEEMIRFLKDLGFAVIAGNVATLDGAIDLAEQGADVIKVGIGPGSLCTTRVVTGSGVPQLSAIMDVSNIKKDKDYPNIKIIADGGIKSSGDIVKALAAGADAVMIGRLFAGCKETPGEVIKGKKVYRGMASFSAQMDYCGEVHGVPEGEAIFVNAKGSVKDIVKDLSDGIKSGLSYSGALNIKELQEKAYFIKVSSNTLIENGWRRE